MDIRLSKQATKDVKAIGKELRLTTEEVIYLGIRMMESYAEFSYKGEGRIFIQQGDDKPIKELIL